MKLEVRDLTHVYNSGDRALDGISLSIESLEPVAIIGQNGAGKTTLVKHLNGILKPTSGKVTVGGVDIMAKTTAEWSKTVGYVFQNPDDQLFLESVRKELAFGPEHIGISRREVDERMEWVADMVGLSDELEVHPFDLTPTQKKFCTIGSVVMMNPSVVIFDEPTCGQDVLGSRRLEEIIARLRAAGTLCITISHDMKFVTSNFPRVIVMARGKVLLDGPAEYVFSQTDTLKSSFVEPPPITRVARKSGLPGTVFTIPAFTDVIEHALQDAHATGNTSQGKEVE